MMTLRRTILSEVYARMHLRFSARAPCVIASLVGKELSFMTFTPEHNYYSNFWMVHTLPFNSGRCIFFQTTAPNSRYNRIFMID